MNIALIDDSIEETDKLADMLSCYEKERHLSFSIDCFQTAEDFLAQFKPSVYPVIFMDIFLEGMNGTDAAGLIRKSDPNCVIIFLTGSRDFMPQAFSCHAFDYIQKPPSKERIFQVMSDALLILPCAFRCLEFTCSRKPVRLLFSDIVCVVSAGHNTDITDRYGTVFSPHRSFSQLTQALEKDSRFLQINRGILVNMDHILSFDNRTCHLTGKIALPVRVRERMHLLQKWQEYLFSQLRAGRR